MHNRLLLRLESNRSELASDASKVLDAQEARSSLGSSYTYNSHGFAFNLFVFKDLHLNKGHHPASGKSSARNILRFNHNKGVFYYVVLELLKKWLATLKIEHQRRKNNKGFQIKSQSKKKKKEKRKGKIREKAKTKKQKKNKKKKK